MQPWTNTRAHTHTIVFLLIKHSGHDAKYDNVVSILTPKIPNIICINKLVKACFYGWHGSVRTVMLQHTGNWEKN